MSEAPFQHPVFPPPPPPPTPYTGSPVQAPVPTTPQPLGRRWWLPLVAITALIAAGLGVLITFLVMESDTRQSDAAIACSALKQIGFPLDGDDIDMNEPLIWQLFGISGFAAAAGNGDDAHAGFERPGQDLTAGVSRIDVDLINDSLKRLSTVCAQTGH